MFTKKEPSHSGMKIIIVGCGKVGRNLAEQLSNEGHDITIIDKKSSMIQQMCNMYDVLGVEGNGASYTTQREAGIENADLLIAVTNSDELNLLCCTIASQAGSCATIARVRTPEYSEEINFLREKLGLTMIINPELEAAREMAKILYMPSTLEVTSFAHGQAELIKFQIPESNMLDNLSLSELGKSLSSNVLIGAIERGDEVFIPSGNFVLKSGDKVCFVASRKAARTFFSSLGLKTKQVSDTMIIGGGRAAYYLADQLIRAGIEVKIIENDLSRCEELSILLPKAIIIHGDGTDKDLLKEEGLEEAASFVPLTGIDEENIMLTLYSKAVSQAKAITKITRIGFTEVINSLDLGSVVYPKHIVAESIIAYVRAKNASRGSNIETLYHMYDNRVEAVEFDINEDSAVTNILLKDIKLKDELLIALISRNGQIIIPGGHDFIQKGDTVMIITKHAGFTDIQDILA